MGVPNQVRSSAIENSDVLPDWAVAVVVTTGPDTTPDCHFT